MKNIEDIINNMDWETNPKKDSQAENKIRNAEIENHNNEIKKERLTILNDPYYLENSDEIWDCAISSMNDVVAFTFITEIELDKSLTFEQAKAKIRKIAPTYLDYKILALNGKTMIQDVVMPQLIRFWTKAHKIVGDTKSFTELDDKDFENLINKMFNEDNENPKENGDYNDKQ